MTPTLRKMVWVLAIACAFCGCHRVDWSSDTHQAVEAHLMRVKRLYEQRDYTGAIGAERYMMEELLLACVLAEVGNLKKRHDQPAFATRRTGQPSRS